MKEDKRVDPSSDDHGLSSAPAPIDSSPVSVGHGPHIETPPNLQSNHADLVLLLGIVSLFMCGPLGVIAWITGSSDLKKIRKGLMSPRKIGTLKVGKALGIIGTCLFAASFVIVGLIVQRGVTDLGFNWKSSPLPPDQLVFAGEWSGKKGTLIRIQPNGRGDFRSHHSSLTGGNVRIEERSLSIGTMGLSRTWRIDKHPHLEDGNWIMELDNEVFVRGGEGHMV
ncbi:MAG: hypothetical protein ACLP5H_28445 [Desulfomonilaceae bacterium]